MTRPLIVLTLRALPGVNADRALKQLLRYAGRYLGLRCTRITLAGQEPVLDDASHERVADVVAHATDVASDG